MSSLLTFHFPTWVDEKARQAYERMLNHTLVYHPQYRNKDRPKFLVTCDIVAQLPTHIAEQLYIMDQYFEDWLKELRAAGIVL